MDPAIRPDSDSPPEANDPAGRERGNSKSSPPNRGVARWLIEIVVIVAAAIILALIIQQFVVKPYTIPSPSMENTLLEGDRVLVNRLAYDFRSPERGDIVVFHPPGQPSGSDPYIKRVIAVAKDTVALRDGYVWLNGVKQVESYVKAYPIIGEYPETTIKTGYVWVMGDNRNDSGDSRVFGQVPVNAIIGEAFARYWPLNRIAGLLK